MTPVCELIAMPAGTPSPRPYMRVCAGKSRSVAEAAIESNWPALAIWLAIGASDGGEFTSFTITLNVLESLSGGFPESRTFTVTEFVLGPSASPVAH